MTSEPDPATWGQTWQGIEPRRTLRHWVAVRKWPVGDHFYIRGFWPCWTEKGAMRVARRWNRRDAEYVGWCQRTGTPYSDEPPQVVVLDRRKHPGL